MQSPSTQHLNQYFDQSLWPKFDAVEQQSTSISYTITINQSLVYFVGHFPQQAVLPGVVQLHWAIELAKLNLAYSGFYEATNIKFVRLVEPNVSLKLSLSQAAKSGVIEFRYHANEQNYSSGKIRFSSIEAQQ